MKKFFLSLLLILVPIVSFAADSSSSSLSFTPPPTDYSVIFLGNLFGIVDGVLHGSGSQIMGTIFKVFNSAVLALGGILIMYILLVSTMNTAHQGEMMGKWSSIWVPMRATIGLALLIPKASGYCLMQIFVMWIVVQGVGAADKIWEAALSYLNRGGTIIQASVDPTAALMADANLATSGTVAEGASQILAGQVCMLGLQKQLEAQREIYKEQEQTNSGPCVGATGSMKQFCDNPVPDFISSVNPATVKQTMVDAQGQTVRAADSFSLDMPNFSSTDEAPYSNLNGICGKLTWNYLDTSDTARVTGLTSSESNFVTQARPLALQQMYLDLSQVARIMVNNDPQITGTTSSSTQSNYSTWARQGYGVPYDSTGQICGANSESCNTWGAASSDSGSLFTGTELQTALADYNGIMMPTLTLIEQMNKEVCYKTKTGMFNITYEEKVSCEKEGQEGVRKEIVDTSNIANKNRKFIKETTEKGWITAGSYFFNLINLSQAAVSNGTLIDKETGIGSSAGPESENLTNSFGDDNSCISTTEDGQSVPYPDICVWFNKDPTRVNNVITLLGAPPSSPSIVSDTQSATAYGFANNAQYITLPGQPATKVKAIGKVNTKYVSSSVKIKKQKFSCGKKILGWCAKRDISKFFYNTMFVGIWNNILSMINPLFDQIFFTFVSLPAAAMEGIFKEGIKMLSSPGINPIVALAQMGTYFINFSGQYWIFTMEMGMLAAKIPYFGIVFLALFCLALPLVTAWLGLMVSLGTVTAFYIPMLPYMIFTFGSIAWLISVIEAMVAAPILALGITHPEGHEAFGKGEQGIMILMNVFLRPSMMIIGYIAGIALSYVGVWILNSGFDIAIGFLQDDNPFGSQAKAIASSAGSVTGGYTNWAGMFGYIFGVIAYVSMYVIIVQRSFSLIAVLPDQILRWIGGQAERTGQEAQQWAEESKGKIEEGGRATDTAKGEIQTKSAALSGKAGGGAIAGVGKIKNALKGTGKADVSVTEDKGGEGEGGKS